MSARPKLEERGARELRDAARAFNTMQDRLHRYLDSRTRVLAAMSHDLKTPLTRLRLQVETLDDPALQARIGHELDEMEGMVREALSLFRGLDDGEPLAPVDINALLATVRAEFADMRRQVTVAGQALQPFAAQAAGAEALPHQPDRQRHQVRRPRATSRSRTARSWSSASATTGPGIPAAGARAGV